jgi:glycosyltransferase involved in cell wall biosynthesis
VQFKRYDLAIINRSFWPKSEVIGESLLRLAERSADAGLAPVVITQSNLNLSLEYNKSNRKHDIRFKVCRSGSDSSSSIIIRSLDAFFFMFWVACSLVLTRPKRIYVATNPPILVPFIVFVYAKIFRARYIYHLQDIHPEIATAAFNVNPLVFSLARWIDIRTIKGADVLVTLTKQMRTSIVQRASPQAPITLLDNPSIMLESYPEKRTDGFVFAGNLGRLQRIPLIIESIKKYREMGGKLPFVFAGGGVYSSVLRELASSIDGVEYNGKLSVIDANELVNHYKWALLPIENEVTWSAFPSKTSTYAVSGVSVLSICGGNTSVAKWVVDNGIGFNVEPELKLIVGAYLKIEQGEVVAVMNNCMNVDKLSIDYHVDRLFQFLIDIN